mgnify:CR=1 FL=1
MTTNDIPNASARRLPIYHRYLGFLHTAGIQRVSSTELSEAVKVDSATIRRDFSYFGALGKRGFGYDVAYLLDFFNKTLHQERLTNVALIGVGNLGQALLNYNFHVSNNLRISAAFDVDEGVVGKILSGVPVYPMSEMVEQLLRPDWGAAAPGSKGSGIGFRNAPQRLQLYCGPDYGLTIIGGPDNGTVVRIRIPALDEEAARRYKKEGDL